MSNPRLAQTDKAARSVYLQSHLVSKKMTAQMPVLQYPNIQLCRRSLAVPVPLTGGRCPYQNPAHKLNFPRPSTRLPPLPPNNVRLPTSRRRLQDGSQSPKDILLPVFRIAGMGIFLTSEQFPRRRWGRSSLLGPQSGGRRPPWRDCKVGLTTLYKLTRVQNKS